MVPEADLNRREGTLSSVERCLDVLAVLSNVEEDLPLQEVAARAHLHPSSAHRLLATLVRRGFVDQQPDRRYRLGLEAFAVGAGFIRRSAIRRAAIPFLMKIAEQTRLTVNLGFFGRGKVVFVDSLPMPGTSQYYEMGCVVPPHATAVGKVLLAFRNRSELSQIEPLNKYTEKTICTMPALEEELARTLREGYALDDEECVPGTRCVAAPILCPPRDPVAAISITGPVSMIDRQKVSELGALVKERCLNISVQLGYRLEVALDVANWVR
jgi:IclR family acetate operon transcriptional repressor